jgi:hypothetical protein
MERIRKDKFLGFIFGLAVTLLFLAEGATHLNSACNLTHETPRRKALKMRCAAHQNSACYLHLPGPITMTVDVHEYEACSTLPNFTSYLSATLTNVPSGSSVPAGTYDVFCADLTGDILDNPLFGAVVYQIQLFSSLNPSLLPSLEKVTSLYTGNTYTIPWEKINYILNKYPLPQNSWLDLQAAIWSLVHGCAPQSNETFFDCHPERSAPYYFPYGSSGAGPYGCPPNGLVDKIKVQMIVQDANENGDRFTPGHDDFFALIVQVQTCSGAISTYCDAPKQILLIPYLCDGGCTLTPGYWKTHSKYGPAPYDDLWALIGEDTPFFLSGQSWYQVLWTSPKGGNAYYILAHHYIAATLNILNGTSSSDQVNEALDWAEKSFFNTYKPSSKLNATVRQQALGYADLLDQYNNGGIGPGHCSE